MPPAAVARHQRSRLEGAMVEVVARHGYAGTTLRELVALAGVSRSTFYAHFESKRECFLATFDEIMVRANGRVGRAYRAGDSFEQQLHGALSTLMEIVVEEPDATTLVVVESLTLGAAGVPHRERGAQAFELLIRQSFEQSGTRRQDSEATIRAIVAGIRGVIYRRLRDGEWDRLPGDVDELVAWALGYLDREGPAVQRAVKAAAMPVEQPRTEIAESWEEPPDSPVSRATVSQRDRILRAAARVVVAKGYDGLSIPAISGAAGVSNQTFYENFTSKRDAFLAAFEVIASEAYRATGEAFAGAGEGAEAIGVAMRAMLEHIAGNELFSRLAFFELPTAGPVALDRADKMMADYIGFLGPETAPEELGGPLSPLIAEAIGAGLWSLIQYEIVHGRADSLPDFAPELTRIALAPFDSL
jgi:AcrR family transcriptional regulator